MQRVMFDAVLFNYISVFCNLFSYIGSVFCSEDGGLSDRENFSYFIGTDMLKIWGNL
jgi:hypothetical protein